VSVSIKDVALKAGVSIGTVSNAINRPDILSPTTLKKVQKAIDSLGFVPNASARTLRAGKTRVLGLVVPDLANPFFIDVSKGVNEAALKAGYAVILCNTDEDLDKEVQYLGILASQKVQGILITPARDSNKAIANLVGEGISLALVDREANDIKACSVAVDDATGGLLSLDHLYELGHRKILLITGDANIPQVALRDSGIKTAIAQKAKNARPSLKELRISQMSTLAAYSSLNEYLKQSKVDFTAIICGNDLIALGAIRALREHNLEVPTDISVIGYDDIDFASSAIVPLTTISQPKYKLGYAAAELVIQDCENPEAHVHQRIEFQPQLVIRNSTQRIKD